jgi:hypothetical protein
MIGEMDMISMHDYWLANPGTNILPLLTPDPNRPQICTESQNAATTDPCASTAAQAAAEAYCAPLNDPNGDYAACHDNVDPSEIYEDCIFDHCADPNLACDTMLLYEQECRDFGEHDFVSILDACGVCHGDGSSCQQTCEHIHIHMMCDV